MMQTQRDKYLVMLIITDGEIHDMQQSIQQIVNASRLPLSILIVGVGNDDDCKPDCLPQKDCRSEEL